MGQFDRPRKNCFKMIATRPSIGGEVGIVHDIDEDIYWVGLGLTVENLQEPPYGVYTLYDKDDAYDKLEELSEW